MWTKEKCRRDESPAFFNPKTLPNVVIDSLKRIISCLRTLSISILKDIHNIPYSSSAAWIVVLGLYQYQF